MQGGSLYLFTDGVTESLDANGQLLDIAGFIGLIQSNAHLPAAKRLENFVAEIRGPNVNQRDDITLMVIDCKPR
jgi:sigma-B regulation protein RsbU (phosphoserine phosphatase)